jgi:protein-L-isoaspartate O-methyltransferase
VRRHFCRPVHSGRALVTALSPLDPWGRQVPTTIAPPTNLLVMALQALDLFDGADVLELGTGTGHTTALLTQRLGDHHVTSVDIDLDLHRTATRHLHARDLRPTLLVGDSGAPPPRANFDRVLVEHEIPTVPPSWVTLVRPRGALLARISGGLGVGGHDLLRRPDGGEPILSGPFLPWTGPLAPHRAPAHRRSVRRPPEPVADVSRTSSTPFPPSALADGSALALLAQLVLPPSVQARRRASGDATWATYLQDRDGSRAEISHELGHRGRYDVRWAGTVRLPSAVEHAHDLWHRLGTPPLTAFGVTADAKNARVARRCRYRDLVAPARRISAPRRGPGTRHRPARSTDADRARGGSPSGRGDVGRPGASLERVAEHVPTHQRTVELLGEGVHAGTRATPMRFYFPDSQDLVSPTYDFIHDEYSPLRVRQRDDLYAHEVLTQVPYDGVLVSKAIVDGSVNGAGKYSESQRQRIYRLGVHRFFRLPDDMVTIGDCGAFNYVGEYEPPYTVDEAIDFYDGCGFDAGVSVDHVILGYDRNADAVEAVDPAWQARQEITLRLAAEFIAAIERRGSRVEPVASAQGWSPEPRCTDGSRELIVS